MEELRSAGKQEARAKRDKKIIIQAKTQKYEF